MMRRLSTRMVLVVLLLGTAVPSASPAIANAGNCGGSYGCGGH